MDLDGSGWIWTDLDGFKWIWMDVDSFSMVLDYCSIDFDDFSMDLDSFGCYPNMDLDFPMWIWIFNDFQLVSMSLKYSYGAKYTLS